MICGEDLVNCDENVGEYSAREGEGMMNML